MQVVDGKYLITTSNSFEAPDGFYYNAAWGDVVILKDSEIFGDIKTNSKSSNWYVKIGSKRMDKKYGSR